MRELFEYLARSSLLNRSPKETEVALEVFGRRPDFDPSRDAVVRVYVHKLRKRLAEISAETGGLTIPLGAYRLTLDEVDSPTALAEASSPRPRRLGFNPKAALVCGALAVALGLSAWAGAALSERRSVGGGGAHAPVWSALIDNRKPTLLVVGDYYIFAELGPNGVPQRLIREYTVDSADGLERFVMEHPDKAASYMDLGLSYLPVGSASSIAEITPMLAGAENLRTIPASALTPAMLKDYNVVYVGYFSGLGLLRDAVFAGSRFSIGETYDDIIDTQTMKRYESDGGLPSGGGAVYSDYGYLSTFKGPNGNRFVIIAGARDAGLMQMAQFATDPKILKALAQKGGQARAAEALFGVDGMNDTNIRGRLILSAPLNDAIIWRRTGSGNAFPAG